MSVTNAISGLTVVGGLLVLGPHTPPVATALALGAIGISSINIAGGFLVSKRMLDLFKKPGEEEEGAVFLPMAAVLAAAPWMLTGAQPWIASLSGLMCIGAICGLSSQQTAQFGCSLGMLGCTGAISTTLATVPSAVLGQSIGLMGIGAVAGAGIGKAVQPMALP